MEIMFKNTATESVVVFVLTPDKVLPASAQALDQQTGGLLSAALTDKGFAGKPGEQINIVLPSGTKEVRHAILLGGGPEGERDARVLEKMGAMLYKRQANRRFAALDVHVENGDHVARMALGARLAAYRFDQYRTTLKDDERPCLGRMGFVTTDVEQAERAFAPLQAAADGTYLARDLVNMPPNDLNPESYAEKLKELESVGVDVDILDEAALAREGMWALLGVGHGSVRESKLGIMRWSGGAPDADPVILVGKGVCFDSGGISLKPGAGMEDMRGDMGGSAAVVGAMLALAKRRAKVNVVGLVGLVENMPDGKAQRPGDIVTSASGQTIEIQNTDAEGRLVLCDVLWYAQEHFKPRAIVDLATLTGAIVIGLGYHHAGLFSNDDKLAEQLTHAGLAEGERVWRLPLGPEYDDLLKSKFADMRNIGGRSAGSITAAQFLQRFIRKGVQWAHLDIAGVAWVEGQKSPLDPSWASGFGPRLLDRWIADNYED